MAGRLVSTPMGNMMAYDEGTDSYLKNTLPAGLYDWLMRGGQILAEGYGMPAPPKEATAASDILRQMIEKQGLTGQIQPQLLPGMILVIQQKMNAGTSTEDLLKIPLTDIAGSAKVFSSILMPTQSTSAEAGRLGLDPLNANIARLEDGSIVNTSSGIGVDINGNIFRVPTQAAARSAGEEAASWASAAANQAQAEASRAAVQRQQDIDAAVRQGRVYDTGQGFVLTPTGNVYDPREVQASLERNQISRDQLKELNRSNLATEAGRAEERQITKDYNATQARLREAEIAQTGAYQQGQLQQGQRRLDLETWVAQQNAAARAEENRLSKEKYIAEVLRNPADWMARSFQMSGQVSPVAQTTQADLINRANQAYAASPTTYVAPQTAPGAPGTPLPQQAPAMAYGSDGLSHYNAGSRLGGFVNDRMAVVGDPQRDGGPNPEIIYNPTGAPISVTPMRNFGFGTLATYANGTPNSSRMMVGGTGGSGTGGVPMISRLVPHYAEGTFNPIDLYNQLRGMGVSESAAADFVNASIKNTPAYATQLPTAVATAMPTPAIQSPASAPALLPRLMPNISEEQAPPVSGFVPQTGMSNPYQRTSGYDEGDIAGNVSGWTPQFGVGAASAPKVSIPGLMPGDEEMAADYNRFIRGDMPTEEYEKKWVTGRQDEHNAALSRIAAAASKYEIPAAGSAVLAAAASMPRLMRMIAKGAQYRYRPAFDYNVLRGTVPQSAAPFRVPQTPLSEQPGYGQSWRLSPLDLENAASALSGRNTSLYAYGTSRLDSSVNMPHYADGTWVGWTPGEGYTVGRGSPLTGESQAAAQASNVGYQAPAATSTPALNPTFYPAGVVANPVNPKTGRQYTPADVSMGKLSGPAYDWYDPAEGGYGYVTGRTVKPATTPGVTTGIAATPGVTTGAPQPSTGMGETRLGITATPAPVRTQEEIQAQAEAGLSGRLRGLFGNTPPKLDVTTGATSNPFEPSGITPIRMPFNLFTPASLTRMTPDELTALRTYLAAYNISLDDALTAVKQSFTPPSTRRGRLV